MRALTLQWSWAPNLVCEVALKQGKALHVEFFESKGILVEKALFLNTTKSPQV